MVERERLAGAAARPARAERRLRRARLLAAVLLVASLPVFLAPADASDGPPRVLGVPLPDAPHLDKLVHLAVFALLGHAGLRAAAAPHERHALLTVFTLLAVYGALVEIAQARVPGRSASLGDWLADVAGAALGIALARMRERRAPHAAR